MRLPLRSISSVVCEFEFSVLAVFAASRDVLFDRTGKRMSFYLSGADRVPPISTADRPKGRPEPFRIWSLRSGSEGGE
jgi:hypothetical protein